MTLLSEQDAKTQTRYSFLRGDYTSCCSFFYVLGFPLPLVQLCNAAASEAARLVFELRGTQPPFFVLDVTINKEFPPGDPRAIASAKPRHAPDAKDFSLTNSRDNLIGVATALCCGWTEQARAISAMAWDPPEARYIGDGPHASCSMNEQRLAYALREYFACNVEGTLDFLKKIRALPKQADIWGIAGMVRAIATRDTDLFVSSITDYLNWFEMHRKRKEHKTDPDFYLAKIPLGLSVLACQLCMTTPELLPQENPRFSIELLRLALEKPITQLDEFPVLDELV
jgi:hypothetical protein